jgi:DNA-binding CsgD family transcriptional regulator
LPLIPFSVLCRDGRLKEAGHRVLELTPGMLLTTGQSASGKVTILLALADAMAAQGGAVVLLTDQADHFAPFRPLPANWTETSVRPDRAAWQHALDRASAADALIVVAPLNRENASAAMALAGKRWVFAALDTLAAGLDASYALREMGVPYDEFADRVRCVWSQFLAEALCDECAADASIAPEELEFLFPASRPPRPVKAEVGCAACDGRGTLGRVAISDVTFITDDARPVIKGALVQGVTIALGPDLHIAARDQAQALVEQGKIGIRTYRDAIQRHPLLRAQNALDLVKTQSAKLSSMFDTFVRSLWLDLDVLRAVADRTAAGVLVVEDDRRVRFANARARQALRAEGELSIANDHIVAKSPRVRRALDEALARAVGSEAAATRLELGAASTANRDVFVTPLPTVRGFASGMRRLALVFLGAPGQPDALPGAQDLREYFDLTAAESRVALLLCAGHVPKEVARQLRVSVSTVRSHLRALLEKTGTARQTELIQLLSSLPCTVSGASPGNVPADDDVK